jgi:hypothetical protein
VQQRRHLERVQDERRLVGGPPLSAVQLLRVRERILRQWQPVQERRNERLAPRQALPA